MWKKLTLIAALLSLALLLVLPLAAKPPGKGKGGGGGEPQPPADPAITFAADGEIWVMNEDGSNLTRVVADAFARSPNWSPDGLSLAFTNGNGAQRATSLEGDGIYVVSREGGIPSLLLATPHPAAAFDPAWSPLDDRIAYAWLDDVFDDADAGQIRAISLDDGTVEILYDFTPLWGVLEGISWSPDATQLTVVVYDYSADEFFLGILEAGTGTIQDVTRPDFDWVGGNSANWARNSDRIAFVGRKLGEEPALWILDLAPDSPNRFRKLVDIRSHSPSWSPDDTRLIFKRLQNPRNGLNVVELATGAETLLLRGSVWWPDWRRF